MAVYGGTPQSTYHSGRRIKAAGAADLTNNRPTYKEDVDDLIYYVHNVDTPVLACLEHAGAGSAFYECVMGEIEEDRTLGVGSGPLTGRIEFNDWTAVGDQSKRARVRVQNATHIWDRAIGVSRSQRTQREFGTPDEYDIDTRHQETGLMLDFEHIMLWSQGQIGAGNDIDSGTARRTHGAIAWAYYTGVNGGSGTVTILGQEIPTDYFYSTYYKGSGSMTKGQFNRNVLQPSWRKGMKWDQALCFVGSNVKEMIAEWSHIYSGAGPTMSSAPLNYRGIPASHMKIIDSIDIYEGPWGITYFVKSHNLADTNTYTNFGPAGDQNNIVPANMFLAFEPRYCKIRVKEAPNTNHLPMLAHGDVGRTVAEMGFHCGNPRAMAIAYDIAS